MKLLSIATLLFLSYSAFAAVDSPALQRLNDQDRQQMREQWESMTQEQKDAAMLELRQQMREERKARREAWQALTPEERAAALELRKEMQAERRAEKKQNKELEKKQKQETRQALQEKRQQMREERKSEARKEMTPEERKAWAKEQREKAQQFREGMKNYQKLSDAEKQALKEQVRQKLQKSTETADSQP